MSQKIRQLSHDFIDHYFDEVKPDLESGKPIEFIDQEDQEAIDKFTFQDQAYPLEEVMEVFTRQLMQRRNKVEHPRNFTFIPGPVQEEGRLADMVAGYYNSNAASHYLSSGVVHAENKVIEFLCQQAGFPSSATGIFVSGGSSANLTAAIAARDSRINMDDLPLATVYISDQAHYSVNKGIKITGVPDERIRRVETDDKFRIVPESLEKTIQEDIDNGFKPFLVVATAGTTNAGVIDPLSEIADVCDKFNLWFHVDGAFGASVLLSKTHRHLLEGISKADSITWDGHKWLFQTYSCAMVLVKDRNALINSFSHNPEYLADAQQNQINPWDISFELSHPARGVKLWFSLVTLGLERISQMIDRGFENAEWVQEEIQDKKHWRIITPAQLGVINFRYEDDSLSAEALNQLNSDLCTRMNDDGFAHIVTTQLHGQTVIRIVALSPNTRKEDIQKIIAKFEEWAKEIING